MSEHPGDDICDQAIEDRPRGAMGAGVGLR